MKKFVLISALTAALAMVSGKASADLVMTVSATDDIQKTNQTTSTAYVGTTANVSLANKQVYAIISNALANVSIWSTNIAPTHLPADGYIAFNPGGYDGQVTGVFYVTNKTGFYYPLSGFDANQDYYSWIELDSQSQNTFNSYIGFLDGWVNDYADGAPFNGVSIYNINKTTGKGSETDTSTALLYIHDDPYSYDDADATSIYYANYLFQGTDTLGYNLNSIEIRGIIAVTLKTTGFSVTSGSASLSGTGNFIYSNAYDPWANVIKNATVTFK